MPIISPTFIEEPKSEKDIPEYHPPFGLTAWEDKRRVELFLNVPPWKCKCGLTMHGRVKQCVRESCRQPRPADYKKGNVQGI